MAHPQKLSISRGIAQYIKAANVEHLSEVKVQAEISFNKPTTTDMGGTAATVYIFMLVIVMKGQGQDTGIKFCPEKCKCRNKTVNCNNAGLQRLPPIIPILSERLLLNNNRYLVECACAYVE